ncbi:hypothetical protein CLOM_g3500 [Closterium sp. NIES-68]|nr:hypothetical protein CLOM_g19819 [Closterium sp. NIES-68]GJP44095.1 hypothetical protein CLOM_g3500 [Closterium sp. NIES-68]GJP58400.1 hypothetical protein CLOP_g23839 [Closterium sp. NIES-67]
MAALAHLAVSSLLLLAVVVTVLAAPPQFHGESQLVAPLSRDSESDAEAAMYIVRLRSAPPLAAYRGDIAGYPAIAPASLDGDGDGDGESEGAQLPAGSSSEREGDVGMTTTTSNSSGAGNLSSFTLGSFAPARARLSMRAPHVRAYADLLARMQAEVASEVGIAPDSIAYSYKHVSNGFAAVLSPAQLRRLVRHSAVASARPSRPLRADTTDSPAFLGLVGRAAAGSARGRGSGGMWRTFGGQQRAGEGVVVGVIDSGIWPEHPSFSDRNFSASRPKGWSGSCDATSDFKCNNKIIGARIFNAAFRAKHGKPDLATDWLSPRDGFGHGTWCAGAAAGNSGVPMEGGRASGMAPAARIAAYKVFWYAQGARPEMRGLGGETADLLAAVNQGVADGVHVLSISLSADDPEATYFDDVPYMHANLAGVTVVMSAGNNGAPLHGPLGTYRSVTNFSPFYLTVGASSILRGGVSLASSPSSDSSSSSAESTQSPAPAAASPSAGAAPVVADFSSSGPLHRPWALPPPGHPSNSVLKPDIIGPGVDLWAAWAGTVPGKAGGSGGGGGGGEVSQLSGTSMATPHLAGIAALIMQKRPLWSPAQVMSAICTTATTRDTRGGRILNARGAAASPWEMGSGHVLPPRVLYPGLTYDARGWAYVNFLAGQDSRAAKKEFPWAKLYRRKPWNLNRPTISVARLKGTVEVFRVVTSVAGSTCTYRARVAEPPGITVSVQPDHFTISPRERFTYRMVLNVTRPFKGFQFGSILWEDGKGHAVNSAIAVLAVSKGR